MLPYLISTDLAPDQESGLLERLGRACRSTGLDTGLMHQLFWSRYNKKHRAYHNLSHLYTLFGLWEHFKDDSETETATGLEWAIWFHDLIYRPQGKDNERKSAEAMRRNLEGRLSPTLVDQVYEAIISTKDHPLR